MANETHFQITTNFWQFGAEGVLAPYVDAYRQVVEAISAGRDGWAEKSSALRQHVLGLLFPRTLIDRTSLAELDAWLDSVTLTDAVARQVLERRDDAERALRCQEAFR